MKTITVLRDNGQGILERCQIAIEPCSEASTGWGIATLGDAEPINHNVTTTLLGWRNESGLAVVHGTLRIPLSQLAPSK